MIAAGENADSHCSRCSLARSWCSQDFSAVKWYVRMQESDNLFAHPRKDSRKGSELASSAVQRSLFGADYENPFRRHRLLTLEWPAPPCSFAVYVCGRIMPNRYITQMRVERRRSVCPSGRATARPFDACVRRNGQGAARSEGRGRAQSRHAGSVTGRARPPGTHALFTCSAASPRHLRHSTAASERAPPSCCGMPSATCARVRCSRRRAQRRAERRRPSRSSRQRCCRCCASSEGVLLR